MATDYSGDFTGTFNTAEATGISLADDAALNIGGDSQDGDYKLLGDGNYLIGFAPDATNVSCGNALWEDCPAMPDLLTNPMCAPVVFFDDFDTLNFNPSIGTGKASTWQEVHTSVAGGAGWAVALATTGSYGVGGVVKITTNNSANAVSGSYSSWRVPGNAFYLSDGCSNDIWFEARIAVSDANEANGIVGLVAADSSAYIDAESGIFWRWWTGSLEFVTEQGTAEESSGYDSTDTTLGQGGTSFSDAEFVRLGFRVSTGGPRVIAYINGLEAGVYQFTDSTTNWPLVGLHPAIEIAQGVDTEQTVAWVDYVKCVQIPHKTGRHIDIGDE